MSSEASPATGARADASGGATPGDTDARALRALAHPMRIALLELLAHTGTLTATRASEVLGESPATCAFHLRTLAKYGFVEEAGDRRGRERPWRRTRALIQVPTPSDDSPRSAALAEVSELMLATLVERARTVLAVRDSWPSGWQTDALSQGVYATYLTLDEARQLRAELHDLMTRYIDRLDHPERRPAGAIPVEYLNLAYPLLHLLRVPAGPDAAPAQPPEET